MKDKPATLGRLLTKPEVEWAVGVMQKASADAQHHFEMAQHTAAKLEKRALANPDEQITAYNLSIGANLPDRSEAGMRLPKSVVGVMAIQKYIEDLRRNYPKDMTQVPHIKKGFLSQEGAGDRQFFDGNSEVAISSLNEAATRINALIKGKAVVEVAKHGDNQALAKTADPAKPGSLLISPELIEQLHPADKEIATIAQQMMTQAWEYRKSKGPDVTPLRAQLSNAQKSPQALQQTLAAYSQELDAESGKSPNRQRGAVVRGHRHSLTVTRTAGPRREQGNSKS